MPTRYLLNKFQGRPSSVRGATFAKLLLCPRVNRCSHGTVQVPTCWYPEFSPPMEPAHSYTFLLPQNPAVNVSGTVNVSVAPLPTAVAPAILTLHWLLNSVPATPSVAGPVNCVPAS